LSENVVNSWHWSNLFLFNDNWSSTTDLWLTEVLPTILFSFITGQYWLIAFYYVWAAFIQEPIEHNPKFDAPFILSGRRHLIHHNTPKKNYGLFFPIWDKTFGTYQEL
jgi:sterol desaturase/sphingolipid hydroxylase (fatty acid hydroxylase superfamily)